MMIKAIETVYNGYKFRSRLEARWAVFFDALGVEYQYEIEGFDLSGYDELNYFGERVVDSYLDGESKWYLPDFYLPGQMAWIEIKPTVDFSQTNKAEIFARAQDKDVFVFMGEPYKGKAEYLWLTPTKYGLFSKYPLFKSAAFTDQGFFRFMHPHYSANRYDITTPPPKDKKACYVFDSAGGNPDILGEYEVSLLDAYAQAMQARFGKNNRG